MFFIGTQCTGRAICYRLSVSLSVTRVDQSKKVEVMIMKFHRTVAPSVQFCGISFI